MCGLFEPHDAKLVPHRSTRDAEGKEKELKFDRDELLRISLKESDMIYDTCAGRSTSRGIGKMSLVLAISAVPLFEA